MSGNEEQAPPELNHAGAVVDQAITFMAGQRLNPQAIASALLAGAIATMVRIMPRPMIAQVLRSAIADLERQA